MEKEKNITPIIISAIIITAIVVGGGVYIWQHNQVVRLKQEIQKQSTIKPAITETLIKDVPLENEPLSYLITSTPVSVSKEIIPFDFTADQLKSAAEECGAKHEVGYFDKLIAKFNGSTKVVYNFKYQGDNQDNSIFVVTLLPNKAGYTSLNQFKTDFDICASGGNVYPRMVNNNWLLFINSCGTGFDDGSGRTHGCDEVRKIVEPSLKLN